VGQAGRVAFSDVLGEFKIFPIYIAGDFPVLVETEHPGAQKHWYRLNLGQLESARLFRFSQETIHSWTDQLEGGRKSGGLVIGSAPGLMKTLGRSGPLFPSIQPLLKGGAEPETYSLSPAGQLLVKEGLDRKFPRFLGVEVAEDLHLAKLLNSSGEVVWSELLMAPPDVVHVLGPY
jgi:hypothetical protein